MSGKKVGSRGLNNKQARFVDEYLIDMNASAAAVRAGYSARNPYEIGYNLLNKPHVKAAIQQAQKKRSVKTGITADRVVQELARIAFADLREIMDWGPDGATPRDSTALTEQQAAAISEVTYTRTMTGGSVKLKMHDKIAALDKLCRHLGLYDEKPKGEDNQTVVVYIPSNGRD